MVFPFFYKYRPKDKEELIDLIFNKKVSLIRINTDLITDMSSLFSKYNLSKYNIEDKVYSDNFLDGIEFWNVSNVKNMSGMFSNYFKFNKDISHWNVSKVKDMSYMFHGCESFNQDLNKWNVSKVETMEKMFAYCHIFNQDVSQWNMSNVTNTSHMFENCEDFNQDLSSWNVSNVKTMYYMFEGCMNLRTIPEWYKN